MSSEEILKRYEYLVNRVRVMRHHQKEYRKYRATSDKESAARLERQVDFLLLDEEKKQKSKQRELL
jgi:hypothetical protein